MASKIHTIQSHIEGRADFAVNEEQNILYSVGSDFMIKKINLAKKEIETSFDISDIYYAIHISKASPSKIILGGGSSSVEIFDNEQFKEGFLAIKCFGSIYKIASDDSGQYLACVSDENALCLYESKTQKIYKCTKTHEASCVNVCFQNPKNQTSKYICSTSCNGTVNVYEIEPKETKVELKKVKDLKISKETVPLNEQILQPHWNETGNVLGLPGTSGFAYLKLEHGLLNYYSDSQIIHDKDISLVHWISDEILVTVGLDKMIKVWNFKSKQLLFSEKVQDFIQNLSFIPKLNMIVFIDKNGQIGFWQEDFIPKPSESMDLEFQNEIPNQNENPIEKPQITEPIIENKPKEVPKAETAKVNIEEQKKEAESTEKKQIVQKSNADNWIDAAPQNNFHSSETGFFKNRRFLCWNLIGTIIIRRDNEYNFLDIDFSDKNFHKNIRTRDVYNFEMGDINYCGAIMASRFVPQNENEYEDEIHNDETKKFSFVHFKCFSYMYEPIDWTVKLQKDENAECVCIGNSWCAVSTDFNYIRIFNFVGVEIKVLNFEKAIVAMAGYENLIAYVFHESVPVLGCQSLRMRVYDVEEETIIIDCPIPITPSFQLAWFGFSHEGLIILQESSGIIKGLFNKTNWVTFYDNNEESKFKRKFWLVGMIDYELIGIPLGKDELEPSPFPLPQSKIIQIELPFIKTKEWWSESKVYEKILWNKLKVDHEKFRNKFWYHLKYAREKYDHLFKYSNSILNENEILNKEKEIEKMYVEFFRECLVKGEYERALNIVSSMVKYMKTIEICLVFCNKMNLGKIAEKINIILNERTKKLEYINSVKGTENNGRSNLMDLSNVQNIQQLPPVKKNKVNLSTLAIQNQKQNSITVDNLKNKKKTLMIEDYNLDQEVEQPKPEKNENKIKIEEEQKSVPNPFFMNQNSAEKEGKTIFEVMQKDSNKKRKMEDEVTKVQKKIKF